MSRRPGTIISRRYLDPSYTATTPVTLRASDKILQQPRQIHGKSIYRTMRAAISTSSFERKVSGSQRAEGFIPTVHAPVDNTSKRGTLPVSLVHLRWWSALRRTSRQPTNRELRCQILRDLSPGRPRRCNQAHSVGHFSRRHCRRRGSASAGSRLRREGAVHRSLEVRRPTTA
jgi:hypothetical protein